MNNIKKITIGILSVVALVYAFFLLIIPNIINLNNYKSDLQKIISDTTNLVLDFENAKIITTPTLKAGIKITGVKVSYPNGNEIAGLNTGEVKIDLIPLIFKTIKISDIKIDTPSCNLVYLDNGQIDIVEYIIKKLPQTASNTTATENTTNELPIKISNKLPVISINNYNFSVSDEKKQNKLILKGNNFKLQDTEINKKIKILTDGIFLVNGNQNIDFNVVLDSYWPMIESNSTQQNTPSTNIPQLNIIKEIVKYSPTASINADLKIKQHNKHIDISGNINADKLSFKLGSKTLPNSFVHVKFDKHKIKIDSNLSINKDENANILANISYSKNTQIDLNIKTDKIQLASIKDFIEALLNSLNIKNDLNLISLTGYMQGDFSVKTSNKSFESSGFFNVVNGNLHHNTVPIKIDNIAANIDFNGNKLNINNTGMNINGTKLTINGSIDSNTNTNIIIKSGTVAIKPIYDAFVPKEIKSMYLLKNGYLHINANIEGKLSQIKPNITTTLSNFLLSINQTPAKISIAKSEIIVNPQTIKLKPFDVCLNSSKLNISGQIDNYFDNLKIDINTTGIFNAPELKSLLPKEINWLIGAKGTIPLTGRIYGDKKHINIIEQVRTDSNRYFTPITIQKMYGKNGLLNVDLTYENDVLKIKDIGLYTINNWSDKLIDVKKENQITNISGSINNISTSPSVKIDIKIPKMLTLSSPALPDSTLKAIGDITVSGSILNPTIKGLLNITDINIPELLSKAKTTDIVFNNKLITVKLNNADINGSDLNLMLEIPTTFSNIFTIKNMSLSSEIIDIDKLFVVMDKLNNLMTKNIPQSSQPTQQTTNGSIIPVKVSKGSCNVLKAKMKGIGADIIATDITANYKLENDWLKIKNLKINAYNGLITGNVNYNLATTEVQAILSGNNIDANPVITGFVGLKDQIVGKAKFDANIKLKGITYEQQMKSLNGDVTFALGEGQMGSLGSFETFLKADNLLTQSFISSKIGSIISSIAPYKTGKFSYLKGTIKLKNGIANISQITMSGPHMSLYITGNMDILTMISKLNIMGNLSPAVIGILGEISNLSVEKIASYIPKFGNKIATALNNYNTAVNKKDLEKIPLLTPTKNNTKGFKVVLSGNLNNPAAAIKQFKWLNTAEKIKAEENDLIQKISVPKTKEEIKTQVKEDLKNTIEQSETVQKIKQNKTFQTIDSIYKFYKTN